MNTLLLAFYGDDFTGSTDALEFLSKAGAKTVLFIEPPTVKQLSRYKDLDAIGVAGISRSLAPVKMENELQQAFNKLKALGAKHVHYKVCSTFDSSPTMGSIGIAIDIGSAVFPNQFIPLLVAAPALGRYCVFGNLFAKMGIGSEGDIYRLDRHPSMSRHPSTPSDESDLRLHLAKQTSKKIGLVDILQLGDEGKITTALQEQLQDKNEIILFDALDDIQMAVIGKLLDTYASSEKPLFSAGSSGIEMCLGNYWKEAGILQEPTWPEPLLVEVLLVVSGSCSPVTSGQTRHALQNGFSEVVLDANALANEDAHVFDASVTSAIKNINEGRSVIVHTDCENDKQNNINDTAAFFGTALGSLVKKVSAQTTVKRIVIAGGDTSSYAARAMGIEAVEMIAPLTPGAPLCRVHAPGSAVDGLEIIFKGGQVGSEDYFSMVLKGK